MKTDKSGKFMICMPKAYLEMGSIHTASDKKISEKDAELIQSRLNSHCIQLCKCFNIGGSWDHNSRIIDTVTSESCEIPPVSLLGKEHKLIVPGKWHSTRPVISGCKSMGVHLTNINADMLEPLAKILGRRWEFVSSEDPLNKADKHNGDGTDQGLL